MGFLDKMLGSDKTHMVDPAHALPGRDNPIPYSKLHVVTGNPIDEVPEGFGLAYFAMGCFWGAERKFWQTPGVWATAVGYQGGYTPNPTYQETCSGQTGHAEVVRVVYDPSKVTYEDLLKVFWENHDPTQGMRQSGDVGTQYRSAIYTTTAEQLAAAEASEVAFQPALTAKGYGPITTDIEPAGPFYFAEDYHQGYLDKNPGGYCGLGGTGASCPVGVARA
jgi:peptide-methionine (S)-S-oxide reductase